MDCSISLLFESVKARLNEPCDEYGLWKVSRMVVTTPDQLGACLRLPHEVTVEVNKDHHNYRDKLYNLLLQWRRRKSNHHGTWADLVKTLSEFSERVLLEGVRDLLKEEDGRSGEGQVAHQPLPHTTHTRTTYAHTHTYTKHAAMNKHIHQLIVAT